MKKLIRKIVKVFVVLAIVGYIIRSHNNILIAGDDDYIDWHSVISIMSLPVE